MHRLGLTVGLVLLVGCVTLPPNPPPTDNRKTVNVTVNVPYAYVIVDDIVQHKGNADENGRISFKVSPTLIASHIWVTAEGWNPYDSHIDITGSSLDLDISLTVEEALCGRVRLEGRLFLCEDGSPFRWRGITWFRFLHQVADNEDTGYLQTLKSAGFNVLRILSTADILFDLPPSKGLENLSRALEIAKNSGFYVEVVGVVDSGTRDYDWRNHARKVAEICSAAINCFFEYANEPGHGVQASELHDLAEVTNYAIQATQGLDIIYSAGSWGPDEPDCEIRNINGECESPEFVPPPIGRYLTPHLDRGRDEWNMIRRMRELERLSELFGGPVVNDEPIGFDEISRPQRITNCDIALTMGVLSRVMEVGTTFHLEAGLRNHALGPRQEQCSNDFISGTRIIDDNVVLSFKNSGWADSPVSEADFSRVVRVYSGVNGNNGITIALGINDDPNIQMKNGWELKELLVNRSAVKVWRIEK